MPGPSGSATAETLIEGAAASPDVAIGQPASVAGHSAVESAFELRDNALAVLDDGNAEAALGLAENAISVLTAAEMGGGQDEAALLITLAEIEETLARFGDAATTIAAAIALLDVERRVGAAGQQDAGPDRDDGDSLVLWCQAQERQAGLERIAGHFDAAATRLTAVLEAAVQAFGTASPAVVSAANALGVVYKHAGCLDEAQAAYERALAAAHSQAVPDPVTEAALLHNLGGLAHSRGDAAAGIPLAERGLSLRIGAVGAAHPDVARDLNALGALYHLAERYRDADREYQRALAIFEDCYGPDHFEVAMTCANLAVLRADEGDFAVAEAVGRRSLRILEAILGPRDAEVGLTVLNLAAAVGAQGRTAEAAELATRAASILADQLAPDHPHVVAAREALAQFGGA